MSTSHNPVRFLLRHFPLTCFIGAALASVTVGCNSSAKSAPTPLGQVDLPLTPAPTPAPVTPTAPTCAANYAPLPLEVPAPAKIVSFDSVLADGELTLNQAQFFSEFKYDDSAPIRLHESEGVDGKLSVVCEAQNPNGFGVSGLEYDIPSSISRTGNPDAGNAQYTTIARKYSLFTTDGNLTLRSVEDATVGRSHSPDELVGGTFLWSDSRLYEVTPRHYELHLEARFFGSQTTRMIVSYDFKAKVN